MPPRTDPAPVLPYAGALPRPRRRPPLWWRLALTLACIYLPYAWLVADGFPWRDYRLQWIKMWPVLPGLMMALVVGPQASNAAHFVAMGAMTVLGVGLFLFLAARSLKWLPLTTLVALALSILNSWIAYAIYRA